MIFLIVYFRLLSVIILIVFIIVLIIIIIILIDTDKDHGQYTPSRSPSSSNNTYKSVGKIDIFLFLCMNHFV
jgi:hypothetical protein